MSVSFLIKKWIIYFAFKSKKKKNPFSLEKSELYKLDKAAPETVNNSYFFGGYSFKQKSALVMRLGLRNINYNEVFVFYKTKDLFLVTPLDYYPLEKTPIKVTCLVPGKKWKINFDGELMEPVSKKLHQVKFECEFNERREIYDFFYSIQNKYMIEATANCKWNESFKKEVNANDQRHYEQSGWLSGTIFVDNQQTKFTLAGGRDHSFGNRNWDYMNDHIWLFAVKDNGEIFNYSIVNYPLLKNINCGYSDFSKDKLISLKNAKIVNYQKNNGLGSKIFKADLTLEDKSIIHLKTFREVNFETHYQNGDYYFQEGIGTFEINGEKAYGSIEFGYNKNPDRWEIEDANL